MARAIVQSPEGWLFVLLCAWFQSSRFDNLLVFDAVGAQGHHLAVSSKRGGLPPGVLVGEQRNHRSRTGFGRFLPRRAPAVIRDVGVCAGGERFYRWQMPGVTLLSAVQQKSPRRARSSDLVRMVNENWQY